MVLLDALMLGGGGFSARVKQRLSEEYGGYGKSIEIAEEVDERESREARIRVILSRIGERMERRSMYRDYCMEYAEDALKVDVPEMLKRVKEEVRSEEKAPEVSIDSSAGKVVIDGREIKCRNLCVSAEYYREHILKEGSPMEEECGAVTEHPFIDIVEREALPKRIVVASSGEMLAECIEVASILADLGAKVFFLLAEEELKVPYLEHNLNNQLDDLLARKGICLTKSTVFSSISSEGKVTLKNALTGAESTIANVDLVFRKKPRPAISKDFASPSFVLYIVSYPQHSRGSFEDTLIKELFSEIDTAAGVYRKVFLPVIIRTSPPIAYAGYTEDECKALGWKVRTVNSRFNGLFYSVSTRKIATDYRIVIREVPSKGSFAVTEKVVGLHFFGDNSAKIIHGFALSLFMGITPAEILSTIPIHPTSSEEVIVG